MLRTTLQYVAPPEALARELRPAIKAALADAVEHWHAKYLPGHFTTAAETAYHYKPRTKRYSIYKAKRFGHRDPLVFTGELKRMVERMIRVSSTSKGARGVMTGPRHLYAYRTDRDQPDKAAELTATTPGEGEEMARLTADRIAEHLNAVRSTDTRSP